MFARILQSRVLARSTVGLLAVGVVGLAALALMSTATTERATARVAATTDVSDAWGHLFDHVNLEEDMMHAYVGTRDETQRRAFAQTIGGAEPIIALLRQMGDRDNQIRTGQAAEAYHAYTATLTTILDGDRDAATLEAEKQQAEFAAAAVRQLVSASLANERQATRMYNQDVDRESHNLRIAATAALSVCLGLLVVCTIVLVGYQRRVERQAATNKHEALHDGLTGLPNRVRLADRLDVALKAALRRGSHVGLLLIDLDGFKEVNDTLGHKFGDHVLQEVAARLNATIRDVDTVARLGGDEFAVLLPRLAEPAEAVEVAKRLVSVIGEPCRIEDHLLEVGASIGVAVYPTNCDGAEQLLQHADIAMYSAKRGRLGVSAYDAAQNSRESKRLSMPAELRQSLDASEVVVHYQPKVDLATGKVCGVEALARWAHPEHGLIPPEDFIPMAEQGGLIQLLTFQVLEAALRQCRAWQLEGMRIPVAVNLSTRCLVDPDFPAKVRAVLDKCVVAPDMLTLEITETAMINNPQLAQTVLWELHALGIGLSIDDFGTAYSSMAYLLDMPITELKIDRCFISQMDTKENKKAIVRSVLALAQNLHLQVVAEGVEDKYTYNELRALGCHIGQGFHISKPLPAVEATAWLRQRLRPGPPSPTDQETGQIGAIPA
jgi:diguanylate cyclase (GGDEF)-like protein